MKLIALASTLALISTVQAATMFSAISSTVTYLLSNYDNTDFWGGIVLGFQYDTTDDTTDCYTSYDTFVTDVGDLTTYLTNLASEADSQEINNSILVYFVTNPYYRPALYIKGLKRVSETGSVFFDFYK